MRKKQIDKFEAIFEAILSEAIMSRIALELFAKNVY